MDDGDVVELYSVSGEPGGIPPARWPIPDELGAIWKRSCGAEDGTQPRRAAANLPPLRHCGEAGPHLLTGPVRVRGAEVGDVLAVEILASEPWVPWGWNALRAGKGALAALDDDDDDDDAFAFLRDGVDETIVIPIDLDARVQIDRDHDRLVDAVAEERERVVVVVVVVERGERAFPRSKRVPSPRHPRLGREDLHGEDVADLRAADAHRTGEQVRSRLAAVTQRRKVRRGASRLRPVLGAARTLPDRPELVWYRPSRRGDPSGFAADGVQLDDVAVVHGRDGLRVVPYERKSGWS